MEDASAPEYFEIPTPDDDDDDDDDDEDLFEDTKYFLAVSRAGTSLEIDIV